jgi:5-hydroxyisourate hydrolase
VSLSTHVLDAVTGQPAVGVIVTVEDDRDGTWTSTGTATTDDDGRVRDLGQPGAGIHRIRFDTGGYFRDRGIEAFYPEVTITFEVVDAAAHHHVPLLLSPFAFSTYRGS